MIRFPRRVLPRDFFRPQQRRAADCVLTDLCYNGYKSFLSYIFGGILKTKITPKGAVLMPKSPNQKLKLLYLMQILLQRADEAHPMTVAQMIIFI